jgi:hypothetical protein
MRRGPADFPYVDGGYAPSTRRFSIKAGKPTVAALASMGGELEFSRNPPAEILFY